MRQHDYIVLKAPSFKNNEYEYTVSNIVSNLRPTIYESS